MELDDGRVVFEDDDSPRIRVMVKDPVCGVELEKTDATAAADYHGEIYYFCSAACKVRFLSSPQSFVSAPVST
jgi:YHS domain-containing protein